MKYVSYTYQGRATYGHVDGGKVSDLGAIPGAPADLVAALKVEALAGLKAEATIPFAAIALLPVVTNPSKIFCVGHNYESHRVETGRAKVGHPSIFLRFADTLNAHGAEILCPTVSTSLDYEGELAVIIGKGGALYRRDRRHAPYCRPGLRQRRLRARLAMAHDAVCTWQEFSDHRAPGAVDGNARRNQ